MNKEELFKKYNIDESHSKWDATVDDWISVEVFRVMHEGRLPGNQDTQVKYIVDFLDKVKDDMVFVRELMARKEKDFGSLFLTAKRLVYSLWEPILEELNGKAS